MKKISLPYTVSEAWGLIPEDIKSIWRGALVATAGAVLTYITQYITGHDFGAYTPIIVAVWGVVVNTLRKYLTQTVYVK